MKRTAQEIRTLKKELTKTRQLEHKVLAKESREPRGLGLTGKIREKIPEKAMASLEVAFEKGFTLIFTKGDGLIDKMGIEKARRQYEIYAASLEKMIYEETLKAIDKTAGSRTAVTKGISTAEGSGLGIFGIGLPDIPIFLAMLLKASYEIAAGYGIDFRDEREKRYTLALFNTIFAAGQDKWRSRMNATRSAMRSTTANPSTRRSIRRTSSLSPTRWRPTCWWPNSCRDLLLQA